MPEDTQGQPGITAIETPNPLPTNEHEPMPMATRAPENPAPVSQFEVQPAPPPTNTEAPPVAPSVPNSDPILVPVPSASEAVGQDFMAVPRAPGVIDSPTATAPESPVATPDEHKSNGLVQFFKDLLHGG